jgi:hypothetical protein
MILSVSKTQSTLYDQIEYAGDPAEFAWVLPTKGIVDVGLSSDLIFNQLGVDTGVQVLPPPINCPALDCGYDYAQAALNTWLDRTASTSPTTCREERRSSAGLFGTGSAGHSLAHDRFEEGVALLGSNIVEQGRERIDIVDGGGALVSDDLLDGFFGTDGGAAL